MKRLAPFVLLALLGGASTFYGQGAAGAQRIVDIAVFGIPEEIEPFTKHLVQPQRHQNHGVSFTTGRIGHTRVVVGVTGFGKVNAATTATMALDQFHPRAVLFTGTSGAANPSLQPGDLIIGQKSVQYDLGRLSAEGFEHWKTKNPATGKENPLYFLADAKLLAASLDATCHVRFQDVPLDTGAHTPIVIRGTLGTGDTFVAHAPRTAQLRKELRVDAVEMEGAAVAQVCYQRQVPCLILRSASDNANGEAPGDYARFLKAASVNSAALARGTLIERERLARETARIAENRPQRWEIAFELPFGWGSPYSKRFPDLLALPYEEQERIERYVLSRLTRSAAETVQLRKMQLTLGPGIYPDSKTHVSAVVQANGDAHTVNNFATAIGYLSQQTEVLGFAFSPGGEVRAVEIRAVGGARFMNPLLLDRFWSSLGKSQPRLAQGFMPLPAGRGEGIRIADLEGRWSEADRLLFERAIHSAASGQGVRVLVRWGEARLFDYLNPWSVLDGGERYLDRLTGSQAARVRQELSRNRSKQVEKWIEEALAHTSPDAPPTEHLRPRTGARLQYLFRTPSRFQAPRGQ